MILSFSSTVQIHQRIHGLHFRDVLLIRERRRRRRRWVSSGFRHQRVWDPGDVTLRHDRLQELLFSDVRGVHRPGKLGSVRKQGRVGGRHVGKQVLALLPLHDVQSGHRDETENARGMGLIRGAKGGQCQSLSKYTQVKLGRFFGKL